MRMYTLNDKKMPKKEKSIESIIDWLRTQLPIHCIEISEGYFTFKIEKIDRVFVIDEVFLSCSFLAKKSEQSETLTFNSLLSTHIKNNFENYFPIAELIESRLKEKFL